MPAGSMITWKLVRIFRYLQTRKPAELLTKTGFSPQFFFC
jgi:hypothetical protein